MRTLTIALCTLALTGCTTSYMPQVATGGDAAQYKTDVSDCQDAAGRNYVIPIVTPVFWFMTWHITPETTRQASVNRCMTARGYRVVPTPTPTYAAQPAALTPRP